MAREQRLFFRQRHHNPSARPVKIHPYDIWGTLYRLQQWEVIKGQTAQFYDIYDIAALLFSNWNELSEHQRQMAALTKVEPAMLFLRIGHYVHEEYEIVYPHRHKGADHPLALDHKVEYKKRYKAKGRGTFHFSTPEYAKLATWSTMDEHWGKWNGRRGLPLKYRYLVDAA